MQRKKGISTRTLYKIFIYVALLALAISIIVPVGWVFLASIKENSEFYGNPWTMPKGPSRIMPANTPTVAPMMPAREPPNILLKYAGRM